MLEHLHVEAADLATVGAEAELDDSAGLAVPLRVGRPPISQSVARGQCLVDLFRGRLDSDSMQNIRHDTSPYGCAARDCVRREIVLAPAHRMAGVTSVTGFRWTR